MTNTAQISQVDSVTKVQISLNKQDQVTRKYNKYEQFHLDSVLIITKSHTSKMDRVDQTLVDKLCTVII